MNKINLRMFPLTLRLFLDFKKGFPITIKFTHKLTLC